MQGQGQYPVDNNTYNLLQVVVSKLESLEAYQKYQRDADDQSRAMYQELMQQDTQAVKKLLGALKQALQQQS